MSKPLSVQIAAATAALKANENPTPEQVVTLRLTQLDLLGQLQDFAADYEQMRRRNPTLGAGAAQRLYRWLEVGRRRPRVVETAAAGDRA